MKILVLGAYCSCNLGDAVICDCVAKLLRSRFPKAQIVIRDVIARDRTLPRALPEIAKPERFRKKDRILRKLTKYGPWDLLEIRERRRVSQNREHLDKVCGEPCDLAVFAGGQMFMDRYALFLEACVERLAARGVPVFFNACGTGPNDSPKIRRVLGNVLSDDSVAYLSCRDDVDLVNAKFLRNGKRAAGVCDPALRAAETYNVRKKENSGIVGLGVIYPNAVNPKQAMKLWQEIIRELERRGKRWQFFSNGDPADIAFAKQVIGSMPETVGREADCILPWDVTPQSLVENISKYESLISYRLHSHIIATSLDIPTVALVWDDKLRFYFEKIGHPERCFEVSDGAKSVVDGLERAVRTGYDRELLSRQAEASAQQLIDAILTVFPQWR